MRVAVQVAIQRSIEADYARLKSLLEQNIT